MRAIFDFRRMDCVFDAKHVYYNNAKTIVLATDYDINASASIINLYEEFGLSFFEHLSESSAFCLYDSNEKKLLAVRDKIGEKSLYYTQLPMGFVFSSELKDVLNYISCPTINAQALAEGIRFNFPIELQQTWIEQIKRLRAGEFAVVDSNGLRLKSYWKRNHTPAFSGSKQDAIRESLRLMRQSVKNNLEADGPVAVLLSGGIDSSSLAALAKECQKEVHVISVGYRDKYACDERDVARRFAKERGLIYHELELDVNDFKSLFSEYVGYLDEPCFDVSSMSQFALYKKASEMGFKVILSGLGGDEQFYSYVNHNKLVETLKLRKEFQSLMPVKRHKKEYLSFLLNNWKFVLKANYPVVMDDSAPTEWTYKDYCRFAEHATLHDNYNEIVFKGLDVHHSFAENTGINEMYDFVFSTFMTNMCVYLGNKLCAANGIEMRCPLLSPELVTFLDSLPLEMKFDVNRPKQFQKDIMTGVVPDYILYARKRGFEPPFTYIRQMAEDYVYKRIKVSHSFFNSMAADAMIDNLLK